MDRRFIIERQGKEFVLYAGLLNEAHEQGLVGIETQIVQVPTEDNGRVAICTARATLSQEGIVKSFTGIGDADPGNVSRMMLPHLLRMAETRAKARALRDAVNVGAAALEELGGDAEEESQAAHQPSDPTPIRRSAQPTPEQRAATYPPQTAQHPPADSQGQSAPLAGQITQNQIRAIYAIGKDKANASSAEMDEKAQTRFGATVPHLTRQQASDFIGWLQSEGGQGGQR